MPLSSEFFDRITRRLSEARPVRTRKMFGGLGIYLGDVFFGICDDDRTYFKVDALTVKDYESRGMGPWILSGEINDNYREVPGEVLSDAGLLGEWIDASVEAAGRKKK